MSDHASMRSVADFVLDMIGQCRNLDELLAVQRNPSFISRRETLRSYGGAPLVEETINAQDAKMVEFGFTSTRLAQSDVKKDARG